MKQGEAEALVIEFTQAAARATTEDRMRILAAAADGVLTPDLTSEMRSRVSRVLQQLEPSDVIALREIVREIDRGVAVSQVGGEPESRMALQRAGCITVHS